MILFLWFDIIYVYIYIFVQLPYSFSFFCIDEKNVMTCIARYTQPINGTSKGSAMWLVDFPHCSSMNEGIIHYS